jgi:Na+/H+ antiporter NhaD/arsenite permease-like protein
VSWLGVVIFGLTYVLISARRLQLVGLDRPAAALLGAIACVAFGVLSPEGAVDAIDGSTILLLFGVMGMGTFLSLDGFLEQLEDRLVRWARTPTRLLGGIVWSAGLLSALITNDAVCVLGAPLLVRIIQRHRLPALPMLLALATGANTGSVATLVGNPQNMLCGVLGDLSYAEFALVMVPVALVGLAINHALLWGMYRSALGDVEMTSVEPTPIRRPAMLTTTVLLLTAALYSSGTDLGWTAVSGFVVLLLLHRRDTREVWARIDWSLLVFFAALFVAVAGLMASGAPAAFFERFPLASGDASWMGWSRLSLIFLVGSNIVSNVPFILVVREQMAGLPDARLGWEMLAMASTFAGNLTLLGSVANVIVAESGREVGGMSFFQHLRVGLPLALLTTAMGTAWLIAVR